MKFARLTASIFRSRKLRWCLSPYRNLTPRYALPPTVSRPQSSRASTATRVRRFTNQPRFPKLPEHIAAYRRAFHTAGHGGNQEDIAVAFPLYVADSEAQVRREVEASFMHYYDTITRQARLAERDDSPSYAYLRELRQRIAAMTWEAIDRTMALYGSPDTCRQKLKDAHEQCGDESGHLLVQPGGLVPHKQVMASMRRFATEVMPAGREL